MNTRPNIQRPLCQKNQSPTTHRNIMHPIIIVIQTASSSAETGRVLCIGIQRDGLAPHFISDEKESSLLRRFWLELDTRESDEVIVTFQGHRFGFPFLIRRSFILDVPVPDWLPRDGLYPRQAFTDVVELWQCGNPAEAPSLDSMARLCGLTASIDCGADFAALWQEDRPAALARLSAIVALIHQLWRRMVAP